MCDLPRHQSLKESRAAIFRFEEFLAFAESIPLNNILGSGSERWIHLHRLPPLGPSIHSPQQSNESIVDHGLQATHVLQGEEGIQYGAAPPVQVMIPGCEDGPRGCEGLTEGPIPLSALFGGLRVELVYEVWIVHM